MTPLDAGLQERSRFRAPAIVFWAGVLVRVGYITLAHTYRFSPFEDHFTFGYEMARIARALVTGYGYADPFSGHTGPTAWVPPLYPLLIAAVFKIAGVYTPTSGWILLSVNSVFSAATALCVYEIGARCYNRSVAVWSAWIWALYPAAMQYAVRWVWETSLSTFLFAAVMVLALRLRGMGNEKPTSDSQSAARWLLFGLLWALIALSNSTLLVFLPVCGVWILLGSRRRGAALSRAVLAGVVFMGCVAPWVFRNWRVFHAFVPMRSNFGAELYAGNGPGSYGFRYGVLINLAERDPQHRLYVQLGELAYVKRRGELAKAWIREHPRHFAALTVKRFYFFWASVPHPTDKHWILDFVRQVNYCLPSITGILGLGLSLKRRVPAAALFTWAFVLVPMTYYFVTVEARFRHPLEPLIVILSVYLFKSATRRKQPALN
ncbi:MAG: glycosyltransferase family 39 protein [Silvibacterium sp.]|nr:glycosyltransferase family 39 protein [Silvibacterium sp.]